MPYQDPQTTWDQYYDRKKDWNDQQVRAFMDHFKKIHISRKIEAEPEVIDVNDVDHKQKHIEQNDTDQANHVEVLQGHRSFRKPSKKSGGEAFKEIIFPFRFADS